MNTAIAATLLSFTLTSAFNSAVNQTHNRIIETKELSVPLWEKYTLTIEEAAKYFGIGEMNILVR